MNQELQSTRWPLPVRVSALIAILSYLTVMVWAPLTTPVGAPHLTSKVEELIAPAQHALFLRHGYRFFAPDPGPTHALVYEIEMADGAKTEGYFPDRENTAPRLMYHRWFMLSETLFREASQLPTEQGIKERVQRYEALIGSFKQQGKTDLIEALEAERDAEMDQVRKSQQRCETMLKATARVLLNRFGGSADSSVQPKSIRLWIQSRDQPTAEESIAGMELTDPVLMSRVEVGFYEAKTLLGATENMTPGQSGAAVEVVEPAEDVGGFQP